MFFEKIIIKDQFVDMPMACNCGIVYDPDKSQSKWTGDQKHNSGTCKPA